MSIISDRTAVMRSLKDKDMCAHMLANSTGQSNGVLKNSIDVLKDEGMITIIYEARCPEVKPRHTMWTLTKLGRKSLEEIMISGDDTMSRKKPKRGPKPVREPGECEKCGKGFKIKGKTYREHIANCDGSKPARRLPAKTKPRKSAKKKQKAVDGIFGITKDFTKEEKKIFNEAVSRDDFESLECPCGGEVERLSYSSGKTDYMYCPKCQKAYRVVTELKEMV